MYVFLSPHFDDAIGSAGGLIKRLVNSGEKCCVMTIMAAIPWHRPHKVYYVLHRRLENRNAANILKCSINNAPFFDAIYRKGVYKTNVKPSKKQLFTTEITEFELIRQIQQYILKNTECDDILIAPTALGNHIDHRIVNEAAKGMDREVYFYEEFYYDIKEKHSSLTSEYEYFFLDQTELCEKLRAMMAYKKTLRKLFGKSWKKKIASYFILERTYNNNGYERYNKQFE